MSWKMMLESNKQKDINRYIFQILEIIIIPSFSSLFQLSKNLRFFFFFCFIFFFFFLLLNFFVTLVKTKTKYIKT